MTRGKKDASRPSAWLRTLHQARLEFQRLRAGMAALKCDRETAWDLEFAQGSSQLKDEDRKPCWKATFVKAQIGDFGRVELPEYWDHAGGNSDDGDHHLLWCTPCQSREKLRPSFVAAKSRLAHLKGALWGFAKREAEKV